MAVIQTANGGHVGAYGNDPYTEKLQQILKQQFGEQAQGFPVFNGTGVNVLALQALLPRWGRWFALKRRTSMLMKALRHNG
ncbi:beta-eliminating lyase-related protein [Kingella kingae]|nr:beta-eliminating lyase-related protein [Kingella kingae]MDK4567002.1 beta-eliminating lyase-related protein [Kingella kingae]MDK4590237.1 beta-eliminating lyase-related protein [Kingella kingae]MDK4628693.1 beta-eliminating lyase-related protein [Kingella kingae]MDK4638612.1 beta-eliminating lyase-related protein [Kingella kingae]MDK4672190.1 beta-eliminating lyase-related protein [Kingella kingae]